MTATNWETVDVPAGSYIGWGATPGQVVIGKVIGFNPTGGTDFAGAPCPELNLELIEPAYSMNKENQRFDYDAGQLVNINAGGANLKRGVMAAQPAIGDLIKIAFDKIEPLSGGRSVKCFSISIARGAGKAGQAPAGTPPQQQAQQPAPTAAAVAGEPVKPDNFPQEVWDTLAPEARAAVLAQQ